jgi:hypothetical protein
VLTFILPSCSPDATGFRFAPSGLRFCAPSGLRIHSSPCTVGMSCVGAICRTGLAGTEPVVTGAAACTSAGFGAGAAACWIGAGAGLAASGFAFGTGTVRLAT